MPAPDSRRRRRSQRTAIESPVTDAHALAGVTRRDFLKRAAALSLSSAAGLSLVACRPGSSDTAVDRSAPSDLARLDGMGMSELVRNGQITPLELVEAAIRRTEQLNARLGAVVPSVFDAQSALARAEQAPGQGRLVGVPVMIKNLTDYEGACIDSGSRLYARAIERGTLPPEETSQLITAMEASGMIVTGVTNSPELGLIDTTEPILHGPTHNPWNLDYSPGGSSGGSAAAVAAGIVPIAHGNDGGGSIRLPASHCGIFGLKPSRGRERGSASANADLAISSDLCLTRSVRDTAAFLSIVEDPGKEGLSPVGFVAGRSSRRLRVALMTESFHGVAPHPEVEQGVRDAAVLCEQLGHEVEEVALPVPGEEFIDAFIGFWATSTVRFESLVADWLGLEVAAAEVLEPWTLGLIGMAHERGRETSILRAMDVFTRANQQMRALFDGYDVMLSPVFRVPPFLLGYHDPTGDFDTILERVLDAVAYTPLQNATGMPGMSVPLHWTAEELPVGVQFSAWRGEERTLLELAYELEEARPWSQRTPPIFAR